MSFPTRDAYQGEIDKDSPEDDDRPIEYGTIGHDGVAELLNLGTSGANDEQGPSYVRVTLYSGKSPAEAVKPGIAQGRRIVCELLGPLFYCPPRGTRVAVCWPMGRRAPGLVMGTVGFSPTAQFKETRAMFDFGPNIDLVLKARTVVMLDHTGDATGKFSPWIGVGPIAGSDAGIYINDGHGAGFQAVNGITGLISTDAASPPAAKGLLQMTGTEVTMSLAGGGYVTITAAKTDVFHKTNANVVAATVGLGNAPNKPVLGGLTGPTGIPSLSVLVGT